MNALVLDVGYTPIGVIPWQKAISLFYSGKIEILSEYDREIRSVSLTIKMPAVIRLLKWFKARVYSSVRFNKGNLYLRDGGKCAYCSTPIPISKSTYDHVIPKSKGGKTDWTNIVLACHICNRKKDCRTPEEAGLRLEVKPYKPSKLDTSVWLKSSGSECNIKWSEWINLVNKGE